jgi:biotin operon repressor
MGVEVKKIKYFNVYGYWEAQRSNGTEKSPLVARHSSCTAMLPTRDIMVLFQKGLCMPRGRTTSLTIRLTPAQRQTLLAWQRATTIPAGLARRGRILLLLADGMTITDIATTVGMSRRHVYKWIQRFLQEGLEGLVDKPGRGHRIEPPQPGLTEQHDMDAG